MKPITERDIQKWLMREDTEIRYVEPESFTMRPYWLASGEWTTGATKFTAIRKAIRAERKAKS